MWRLRRAVLRLFSLVTPGRADAELARELTAHQALLEDEYRRRGLDPAAARLAARRALGNAALTRDAHRDARAVRWLDDLRRDVRYACRSLARNRGFTLGAILTLGLGVGANTAAFSVVNAVLLMPLPYSEPERIVKLANASAGATPTSLSRQVSIPDVHDWRARNTSFDAMAYYASRETAVMVGSVAEYARVTRASADFFDVFKVAPVVGRVFNAEETAFKSGGALVVSYDFWQSRFGGAADVQGRSLRLYGRSVTIVGVMPAGFSFPDRTDVWLPADTITSETRDSRSGNNYLAVGRLKSDTSLGRAQSEMTAIASELERQYPDSNKGRTVSLTRLGDDLVGDLRRPIYLLWGAVGIVLLIACANTAMLLLSKSMSRSHEIAVRGALGAGRLRIVRQVLTESVILACAGGAVGVLIAVLALNGLVASAPPDVPRIAETRIDLRVLLFTLGTALTTGVLFGLVPALFTSKMDLNQALRQGGQRAISGAGVLRVRGALVVAQIALSVVLLAAAGLVVKSFIALRQAPLGFRPENVLVMKATVPRAVNTGRQGANQFFHDVLDRISTVPGVAAVGATMAPPGLIESSGSYFVDRLPAPLTASTASAVKSIIAPRTFAALGIPIVSGRDFDDRDHADAPFTAIVNQALVRESLAGQDPLGRIIYCPFDSMRPMTIVGVVGDVRQGGPAQKPMPECFMPYQQHAYNGTTLSVIVRAAGDPQAIAGTIRSIANTRSAEVPVQITTMEASLAENVAGPRFQMWVLALFAVLSSCLVATGVYGMMAYAVGQRSSEIGLRLALGASRWMVLGQIVRQGLVVAAIGLAIGTAGAFAVTRLLTTMLFEVKPNDPTVFVLVLGGLAIITVAASLLPARRAASIDPLIALRHE
jgi:predicted permease